MKCVFAPILVLTSVLCSVALAQPVANPKPTATVVPSNTQQAASSTQTQVSISQSNSASVVQPDNWQCVLHAAHFNIWRLEVTITTLSTYRLQNCPASSMDRITSASVAAQLRTVASFSTIVKGGSHQQVMDINLTPVSSEYFWVSDLKFAVANTAQVSLKQLIQTTKFKSTKNLAAANYIPFKMHGEMHYIWNTGTLAHRLVSPQGETYIMTNYTQEVQPILTRDTLSNLDTMLRLPPGWKFENYFLDRNIVVRSGVANDNTVEMIFDDLNNNYVLYE